MDGIPKMAKIQYERGRKEIAQELRKHMTRQERHLWYDFLRMYPAQFRRQKQFGRFIVDFYCAEAALVVEVDGAPHWTEQGKAYDQERTWYLESLGLRVMRIPNSCIDHHFDDVCREIDVVVGDMLAEKEHTDPNDTIAEAVSADTGD